MNDSKLVLDYLDKTGNRHALKAMFETVFDHTMKYLKKDQPAEVSLSLVSKDEIHSLNKEYRDMDRPTDVLTFAFLEADVLEDEPVLDLGSIIICPEIAKEQAKKYKHPYIRELAFLFIHGLLHSLGYDHMKEEDEKIMFPLQNAILNSLPYDFYTNQKKVKKLLLEAQSMAMAEYSDFHVGAIVMTKDGRYHRGFNIENSAYPVTICAERCALFATYSLGYHKDDIVSLSLITSSSAVGSPCGSCRQVISELMNPNCPVYIYNKDFSQSATMLVKDLLPLQFDKEAYYA